MRSDARVRSFRSVVRALRGMSRRSQEAFTARDGTTGMPARVSVLYECSQWSVLEMRRGKEALTKERVLQSTRRPQVWSQGAPGAAPGLGDVAR